MLLLFIKNENCLKMNCPTCLLQMRRDAQDVGENIGKVLVAGAQDHITGISPVRGLTSTLKIMAYSLYANASYFF